MQIPITQFRREIFALVNRALEGETILVTHKGYRFRIIPELQPSTRFDQLTSLQVISPHFPDLDDKAMKEEMAKAWEKDWANL